MPDVLDRIGDQLVAAEHALHAAAKAERRDAHDIPLTRSTAQEHTRMTRRRSLSSRLVAAGVALTVAGGGYAAAAAAGVVPSPWSGPAVTTFVASPDPAGTVRLAVPGPDSTILQIVTDTVPVGNGTAECTGLVVKETQRRSVHVMSACGGPSAARAENGVFDWQAPSGATFSIVTGEAPARAAKVSLTDRTGTTTTEPTGGGYFVAYLPTQEMPATGTLDFYNPSGQVIGSQTFGAAPAGGA